MVCSRWRLLLAPTPLSQRCAGLGGNAWATALQSLSAAPLPLLSGGCAESARDDAFEVVHFRLRQVRQRRTYPPGGATHDAHARLDDADGIATPAIAQGDVGHKEAAKEIVGRAPVARFDGRIEAL